MNTNNYTNIASKLYYDAWAISSHSSMCLNSTVLIRPYVAQLVSQMTIAKIRVGLYPPNQNDVLIGNQINQLKQFVSTITLRN